MDKAAKAIQEAQTRMVLKRRFGTWLAEVDGLCMDNPTDRNKAAHHLTERLMTYLKGKE